MTRIPCSRYLRLTASGKNIAKLEPSLSLVIRVARNLTELLGRTLRATRRLAFNRATFKAT
jgi:hypothetical protein